MPLYKPYKLYICTRFSTQVLPTRPWHPLSPPSIEVTASKGSSRCIRPTPHEASVAIKPEQLDMSLTYTVFPSACNFPFLESWDPDFRTPQRTQLEKKSVQLIRILETIHDPSIPPFLYIDPSNTAPMQKRQSDRDGNVRPITQL